jgi:hypothetical protein
MNTRLRELMVEADYPAPELALRAQKLSELIIQECVQKVEMLQAMKTQPSFFKPIILDHFGLNND